MDIIQLYSESKCGNCDNYPFNQGIDATSNVLVYLWVCFLVHNISLVLYRLTNKPTNDTI